jgi:hypothetical protein
VTESSTLSIENVQNLTNPIIFPNPTIGDFIIKGSLIGDEITFIDIHGKTILTQVLNANEQKIEIENIEKGTYFVLFKNSCLKVIKY